MTITALTLLRNATAGAPPQLLLRAETEAEATAYAALPEEVAGADAAVSADDAAEALADLEPIVLDREPRERGALWERMALAVNWREEPEPAAAAVLSALDLVLWQLAAAQAQLPLHALLGGRFFPRSDTYELLRPELAQATEAPAGGVLITGEAEAAVAQAEDLRRRWGDQGRLFMSLPGTARGNVALELGRRLQAAEVFWCLDLLPTDAAAEYRDLGQQVELPLGAGALATGLRAFRQLLREQAVDLLGVDLRRCGGITGALRVATFAAAEQIPVAVLAGPWALNQLLALHLAATSGIFLPAARPDARAFSEAPFALEEGFARLPEAAGLGTAPTAESLSGYEAV